jgi:predicted ATPase
VAQLGAALGRQFSHELISAVAAMPQHQLDDALAQLVGAELIFRRGTPPDAEYTFKHALVQDAAYGTLLRSRRQQIHTRIATTLQNQYPDIVAARPQLMAQHCAEAGLSEQAVGYWLKAGHEAIARGAMVEAAAQLRKGLDLLSGVPDGAAHQEQELSLESALGQALLATKGYSAAESGEAYARARQLCEQLNRPAQLGPILIGQFLFRIVRGELEQAEHHAAEMRHLGEARDDVIWKFLGASYSGGACMYLGKLIDARTHLEEAVSIWDPMFRTVAALPEDPYVPHLLHFSRTLACLGYVNRARLRLGEALAEARQLSPYRRAFALRHVWYVDWAIERVNSARAMLRSADEVLAISTEQGFPGGVAAGNAMRGWCLGALGQPAAGIPLLLQGIAGWSATGAKLVLPFFLMTLAEVYGMAAQPEEGLERLAEAAKLVETTQERWAEAEMHRLRGKLLLSMHENGAAENSYRHALKVARQQSAKFWELRAALDLARLWRDQSKCAEARELLAHIYGWFTEGFDTPVLKEAKALLDQLA